MSQLRIVNSPTESESFSKYKDTVLLYAPEQQQDYRNSLDENRFVSDEQNTK